MSESFLDKAWSLLPTTLISVVLLALAVFSVASGALDHHGGRVIVIALIGIAILTSIASIAEVAPRSRTR